MSFLIKISDSDSAKRGQITLDQLKALRHDSTPIKWWLKTNISIKYTTEHLNIIHFSTIKHEESEFI